MLDLSRIDAGQAALTKERVALAWSGTAFPGFCAWMASVKAWRSADAGSWRLPSPRSLTTGFRPNSIGSWRC